ncbi:DgyrCDS6681 [Dimorphilus gyrociliatus]|uniref:DgyrCDS6681 n=1 Tax=Dimorphilus gyrociliatus TaxID=2664684 RepID=A0A7I8VPE0_9ANNE|nr:DgyrCDS6681 [Dimorphilus gyrociliatus]
MSAADQVRAMLDELMGTNRDGVIKREQQILFDDPRVCKSFLLGCCPHDILASTRADLGDCRKIHDLGLRADYEQAAKRKDHFYDVEAAEQLQAFINDCDRKIEVAKKKLKETQQELGEDALAKGDDIHALGEQIGTKLAKAEELGAEGRVEESLALMEEVENLKKRKADSEVEYRNAIPASCYQQQKLRVCEVCAAYLGIHDNDRRLADHFGGKLHLGFIEIRQKLDDFSQNLMERRLEKEKARSSRRDDRRDRRSRSRSREQYRDKRRSRSRDRHRRKHRSRSKSRDRKRKSKDKRKRSRSRSRSNSR